MRHPFKYLGLSFLLFSQINFAATAPTILAIQEKTINVDGKDTIVYTIEQPDGTWGYHGTKGQDFNVIVKNETKVPTAIHWHGLILPNAMDGAPGVTQAPIPPGGEYHYQYKLVQAGTFWMHSHMGLQVQELMAAPFIIDDPNDPYKADQQVVIMFQDFTFKNPEAVFKSLQSGTAMAGMHMSEADHAEHMNMMSMDMSDESTLDLNDVQYDAFLTNYHTLKNPEIVKVHAGQTVRLRFIDGSAGSNYWINLGKLSGTAIAFDGENIKPLSAKAFQLAMGQRIDILVKIPESGGAFPILGQVEGTQRQTGLILMTPGATLPRINETANNTAPALNYAQEFVMKSKNPLPQKPIAQVVTLALNGNMQKYIWTINGQTWPKVTPIKLKQDERVELIFDNQSNMTHPMHLHGHVFELVSINQQKITDGPLHDTILVLPHTQVKVILDADHPGKWMLHCHMAYHQQAGMMTVIELNPQ
jgi:FtsP/CotA-like multicopper oxidase with cupredoxin domain